MSQGDNLNDDAINTDDQNPFITQDALLKIETALLSE
jgi:hypothetical protein